tara:strand:+ start:1347 stop:2189 length:843 start_codon:yes stop_codon:yes gene_type:complete
MPKKKNNTSDLVNQYLEESDRKISDTSKKTYKGIGENIPFNIQTNSQATIIKKLKELVENPNTQSLYLNLILLVRQHLNEETDKLVKHRNTLREAITELRKSKLGELATNMPNQKELENQLDAMTGIQYIINYLFLHYGLRNKDLNLKIGKGEETNENYIYGKGKNSVILEINDYKTDGTYGKKELKIQDKKFIQEFKGLKLNNGDYILSKKNGDKMGVSTFNEKVKALSINNLGETTIFKVVVADLLEKKDFKRIEDLAKTRGTSLSTIMRSYNIYNTE